MRPLAVIVAGVVVVVAALRSSGSP